MCIGLPLSAIGLLPFFVAANVSRLVTRFFAKEVGKAQNANGHTAEHCEHYEYDEPVHRKFHIPRASESKIPLGFCDWLVKLRYSGVGVTAMNYRNGN